MKILTVRSAIPENGPSTQSLTLALEMRARGHDPVFATSGGSYVETVKASGVPIHLIPELAPDRHNPKSIVKAVMSLRKIIARERPDVIHGHNAAATICAFGAGILAGRRLPCVTSVRGVEERSTHQRRNRVWKVTPGILLGVCEKTRERLLGFGVPAEKIHVSYNGVNTDKFDPAKIDRVSQREALGLTGKIVVTTTGAMVGPEGLGGPTKGQHILLKAIAKLKDKHPTLSVLLIGDGPRRAGLEALTDELQLRDRVVFAGRRFDVPNMLAATDIYCLPSIWGEFFPNSIIEAMAMGIPWVGSDIAGLSELTAGNEAGWLAAPGDVDALSANLDKLVSDADLRKARGAVGRQEVMHKFTVQRVGDRVVEAYVASGASVPAA